MNLVDPEGRKIEDPDELVMKFKQNIETKIKEIKDNHASLTSIGIDEKNSDKYAKYTKLYLMNCNF